MIVGRNPRLPVIGDSVLSRAGNTRGIGTIVDTTRLGTRSIGAMGEASFLGMLAAS